MPLLSMWILIVSPDHSGQGGLFSSILFTVASAGHLHHSYIWRSFRLMVIMHIMLSNGDCPGNQWMGGF